MCNLYDIGPTQNKGRTRWEKVVSESVDSLRKIYNIRKTDPGVVGRLNEEGEPEAEVMRWGFWREFNPSINNARSDALGGRMWNKAFREKRRCLIPVTSFYEWTGPKGHKQTHAIQDPEGGWLWMAGLWEPSRDHGHCYTMITTAANNAMESIHDRMPAILPAEAMDEFLTAEDPTNLLGPAAAELEIFSCLNPLRMADPSPPVRDEFLL